MRWTGLVVVLLAAGCVESDPSSDARASFEDFQGCTLRYPDGMSNDCHSRGIDDAAPDWRLGLCIWEYDGSDDWHAIVFWPAQGLVGVAASGPAQRQTVLSLETQTEKLTLLVNGSGQAAAPMSFEDFRGEVISFEESVSLEVRGEARPVGTLWQTWNGTPWPVYAADGHHFQNVTTFTFGLPTPQGTVNATFVLPYASFRWEGADFVLQVKRGLFQQYDFEAAWPPFARPCLGPES